MTTWGNISAELSLILDDADQASYKEELRIACFNRAMQFFALTHTAVFTMETATASAFGEGAYVSYPSGFIQFGGIKIFSDWMEPSMIIPGTPDTKHGYFLLTDKIYIPSVQFHNFPDSNIVDKPNGVELWYYKQYDTLTTDGSISNLPNWSEWAVLNLSLAYMMYPNMIGMADLRRFATKRDSGTPEMNSSRSQAKYHIETYYSILEPMPIQVRTLFYKPRS